MGDKLMFFVEDSRVANELKRVQQISAAGREPLLVIVRPSPPPRGIGRGGNRDHHGRGMRDEDGGDWRGREGPSAPFGGDARMEEDPKTVILV